MLAEAPGGFPCRRPQLLVSVSARSVAINGIRSAPGALLRGNGNALDTSYNRKHLRNGAFPRSLGPNREAGVPRADAAIFLPAPPDL